MSIKDAITTISKITKQDSKNMVETITTWNKEKIYPVSLIDINISSDGVKDNSADIGELVDKIEVSVQDTIKNSLDLESVLDMKKTVAEIGKYLSETRKIQTNPLKDIVSSYTAHESRFTKFNTELTAKIDAINELEYQKAEKAIREYFSEVLGSDENKDIEIEMALFDSFIQAKRKTKVTLDGKLNEGALTKKAKDEIIEQVRLAIEPIRKAKELEAKRSLQSMQFENALNMVKIDGTNTEVESAINSLTSMLVNIENLYPDIIDYCKRAIDNKISFAEANIKANNAIAERNAVQNADKELMEQYEIIYQFVNSGSPIFKDVYKNYISVLRGIYPQLKFTENQEKVKAFGAKLSHIVGEIEKEEIQQSLAPTPREDITIQNHHTFLVSIEDLEVMAGMEIQADSEDEAKEELVERFKAHLSMIDLIRKG
ncbi:MAG: hypothetical protein LHW59_05345 [Candidatus Cloacimonetes bacterium]|nr:hypothetical protein [Candidatus Cloacimonadota bacterium]